MEEKTLNQKAMTSLEFNKILSLLSEYAMSEGAKQRALELRPISDEQKIKRWLNETTEASKIVERSSSIPVHSLHGVEQIVNLIDKGYIPTPDQFEFLHAFLDSVKKIKKFMIKQEYHAPTISSYAYSLYELEELSNEIIRCVRNNQLDDYASRLLAKTRSKISTIEEKLKAKLAQILKKTASYLQEGVITVRNGRYTVSVKHEYKRKFPGTIIDQSASGQTVYMEPNELQRLQDELAYLKIEEELEVQRILGELTELTSTFKHELLINIDGMVSYDFIFAKAKLSHSMKANEVIIHKKGGFSFKDARHPLLGEAAVPLTMTLGKDYDALIITGPNTGGKTVTIKTVGLLVMMVQSGLHVPASPESECSIVKNVFVDIGDQQSIEHSLSTFSSHITNVIGILEQAQRDTLVILDEIGSGTDPREGMGLAVSILEQLYQSGAYLLATTHYSEIKDFAEMAPGFENGSMDFDLESLQPLYKLLIGEGGESQAFSIAKRLGMPEHIINRAKEISYQQPEGKQRITPKIKEKRERVNEEKTVNGMPQIMYRPGDAVWIPHMQTKGIVQQRANEVGEIVLIVRGERVKLNHKRVKTFIEAKELYPEEYDLDQIFEEKDVRKKKKIMNRKYVEGMRIEYKEDDNI